MTEHQKSRCSKCYVSEECMLTPAMRKHCCGPFADNEDHLAKLQEEEIKEEKVPLSLRPAFNYRRIMKTASANLCKLKNPMQCEHSVFVEIPRYHLRVVGCRQEDFDQLCPFPCDEWNTEMMDKESHQ